MFQAGQTAMQNVLTTNPNVKLVIAYASDGGAWALPRRSWMNLPRDAAASLMILSKVAVFSVGMFGPEGGCDR